MAAFLLDVPTEKFADYEFKQKHRLFLQRLGTDVIRKQLNENFWVDKMIEKICRSRAKIIVITDVRFPNEIDYLRLQIGINWRILPVRVFRETTRSLHESETALDNYKKWWRQVSNNQTFEHLRWEAEDILRSL